MLHKHASASTCQVRERFVVASSEENPAVAVDVSRANGGTGVEY